MKINKIIQLFILIVCNVFIFFILVFLGRLLATTFVCFKVCSFLFDWKETILLSLKKGLVIGLTLGSGLWIKAWLQERKNKKTYSNSSKTPAYSGWDFTLKDPRFPTFQKMEGKQKLSDSSTITVYYQYNSYTDKTCDMKLLLHRGMSANQPK